MGGLQAFKQDGVKGVLAYFGNTLEDTIMHHVADGLAKALLFGGQGGGGLFAGLFGGLFSGIPGFADGVDGIVQGRPGVDKNVVRVSNGERLTVTPAGQMRSGAGQVVVHVIPSDYFDVRVAQVSGPIASQKAGQAFRAGQSVTSAAAARQQRLDLTGVG